MSEQQTYPRAPETAVERLTEFKGPDLHDLSDAADAAIEDGGGFGWLAPPPRQVMETYWRGVLLVPERELFVARLDGVIAGSAQLASPPANNEAGRHSGTLSTFFLAPWARGRGLAAPSPRLAPRRGCGSRAGQQRRKRDVRETSERTHPHDD